MQAIRIWMIPIFAVIIAFIITWFKYRKEGDKNDESDEEEDE